MAKLTKEMEGNQERVVRELDRLLDYAAGELYSVQAELEEARQRIQELEEEVSSLETALAEKG